MLAGRLAGVIFGDLRLRSPLDEWVVRGGANPKAPAGLESNWIPTMGKKPYVWLRLHGMIELVASCQKQKSKAAPKEPIRRTNSL